MKPAANDSIHELAQWAPTLAGAGKQMPYYLPQQYFQQFPALMLDKVMATRPATVPDGYFDSFAGEMLKKLRGQAVQQELEAIAPLLNTLPKTMPYSLPQGYFEQLNISPVVQTAPRPAPVVRLSAGSSWKKWAAAAAILISIGFAWRFWPATTPNNAAAMAAVSPAAVDTLLKGVDENSLSGYLENEETGTGFTSLLSMAQQDIETGVKQLSNDELKWYLENQVIESPGS